MPVPTAHTNTDSAPLPAPQRASPSAWACTSFMTRAFRPKRASSSAPRCVPPQPGIMSFAYVMSPVRGSTTPPVDTPMPHTAQSASRSTRSTWPTMTSSTCLPPSFASVGALP